MEAQKSRNRECYIDAVYDVKTYDKWETDGKPLQKYFVRTVFIGLDDGQNQEVYHHDERNFIQRGLDLVELPELLQVLLVAQVGLDFIHFKK